MVRLNSCHREILTKKDFEKYPVWTWDDAMEGYFPIADKHPSWEEFGTYFIKSQFYKDNYAFDGFLAGNQDFYAFGLFLNNELIGFNINLPNWIQKSEEKIISFLKEKDFKLFPLRYVSSVQFKDWPEISGIFNGRRFE